MSNKKKTYLRKLVLGELSIVDRGANPGAGIAIFKRDFSQEERDQLAEEGKALPDGSFPIVTTADLKNAVSAYGRASDKEKAKAHILRRAKALDALDQLPGDWVSKSSVIVEAITKNVFEDDASSFMEMFTGRMINDQIWPMTSSLSDSISSILRDPKLDADAKKSAVRQSVTEFIQVVERWLPESMPLVETAVADMDVSDEDIGEGDETMTGITQKTDEMQKQIADLTKALAEVTKRADDAEAKIAKANKENDEVIKVAGVDIRKSVVGDDTFAVIKSQQEQIAEGEKATEIAKAKVEVEKDYGNLPGSADDKAKAMVALNKMAESDRNVISAMLVAGNKAVGEAMKVIGDIGKSDDTASDAEKAIKIKANEIMKRDSVTFAKAYDKALTENPDLYTAYIKESEAKQRAA